MAIQIDHAISLKLCVFEYFDDYIKIKVGKQNFDHRHAFLL